MHCKATLVVSLFKKELHNLSNFQTDWDYWVIFKGYWYHVIQYNLLHDFIGSTVYHLALEGQHISNSNWQFFTTLNSTLTTNENIFQFVILNLYYILVLYFLCHVFFSSETCVLARKKKQKMEIVVWRRRVRGTSPN